MKILFIILLILSLSMPAYAESTQLPIRAVIINLTQMPIKQAIAFCDERGLHVRR